MPPRPIHRWKTFWLGILILAFLTWAWARSRSQDDYINVRTSARTTHAIGSAAGCIVCYTFTVGPYSIVSPSRINYGSRVLRKSSPWFPQPARTLRNNDKSFTSTHHSIAYWLVILLFLAAWISFILWRRQRMDRHLTAPQPHPQAEPAP